MNGKSLAIMATPLQVRRAEIVEYNDVNVENRSCNSKGKELLQIVKLSPAFRLPDDWVVEERPRTSNPFHKDKYYYEPGTGRQFRSLASIQRYLTEGTSHTTGFRSRTTEGVISENENTMQVITHPIESTSFVKLPNDWIVKKKRRNKTYAAGVTDRTHIEPGTRQRFRSTRAFERSLTGENACTYKNKSTVKPETGNQSAPGLKYCIKSFEKHSSVAEEDKTTLKTLKHSTKSKHSKEFNSPKEIYSGKDNRAPIHNLSKPPTKVKWVLSGPGDSWSPFLDDSIVPDSEKLKWSEAFILAIHDGAINGLNS